MRWGHQPWLPKGYQLFFFFPSPHISPRHTRHAIAGHCAQEVNLDNFMKALEEEAKAAATFFGDDAAPPAPSGKGRALTEVIGEIRKGKGINWALFGV